jgi:hypothetical protein
MTHRLISLRDAGQPPRPWEAIHAELDALPSWVHEVALVGEDPTDSPHLLKALTALAEKGRAPMLFTHGQPLARLDRLKTLQEKGCRYLGMRFRAGTAAAHDGLVGRPGAFERMVTAMRVSGPLDMQMGVVVEPGLPHAELDALAALAASVHADLHVVGSLTPGATDDPAAPPLLDAAWRAAGRHGVRLQATGVGWTPAPPGTPDLPADDALLGLARKGTLPAAARGGVRWRLRRDAANVDLPTRSDRAALLSALGAPVRDLPACEGGTSDAAPTPRPASCAPCVHVTACPGAPDLPGDDARRPPPRLIPARPRANMLILAPPMADQVALLSTFPALAAALTARGAHAQLRTAYHLAFDPADLAHQPARGWWDRARKVLNRVLGGRLGAGSAAYEPPDGLLRHPLIADEPELRRRAAAARLWETVDLRGVDRVVVHDLEAAHRVLTHPDLPAHADVVAADFHMLVGAPALRGAPWPDGRLAIHACFPSYAHLYVEAGVRLADVRWRPYPLHLRHFRATAPGPASLCGGRHLRDTATLMEAARLLGPTAPPIEVITDPDPALRALGPLRPRPPCQLPEFVAAVTGARFLILPMLDDPHHAAGITVLSMAQAAGRPIIASATPAMRDHLRDGVDSLLVPPGDPVALADAIRRLDRDPVLVERLAAGARRAAARASVEVWADELLGARSPRPSVGGAPW